MEGIRRMRQQKIDKEEVESAFMKLKAAVKVIA